MKDADVEDIRFGEETFYEENIQRNERNEKPQELLAPASTNLNQEYKYNILVIPEHISELQDNSKIYFEPKRNYPPLADNPSLETQRIIHSGFPISNHYGRYENLIPIIDNTDTDEDYDQLDDHKEQISKSIGIGDSILEEQEVGLSDDKIEVRSNNYIPIEANSRKNNVHFVHQNQPISYAYDYSVNTDHHGPQFSKYENSDGFTTRGQYSVKLPDGRTQTVSYSVKGKGGFTVNVKYSGNNFVHIIHFIRHIIMISF